MNKVITQKELKEKIGEMVLTFGNLETAISASIQLLVERKYGKELVKVFKDIISKSDSRRNLEILDSYVCSHVENVDVWKECYSSLCKIFDRRNALIHGMCFSEQDFLIKVGKKFDKEGKRTESHFLYSEISQINYELFERYRQIFDSFIDYKSLWICKYPRVII